MEDAAITGIVGEQLPGFCKGQIEYKARLLYPRLRQTLAPRHPYQTNTYLLDVFRH